MVRFRIDKNSVRGVYSTSANIRHYTVLANGRDHGIVLRDAGYVERHSIIINGETVVTKLSESDAVPWLEANLTVLPPLLREQLAFDFDAVAQEVVKSSPNVDADANIQRLIDLKVLPFSGIDDANQGTIQNKWGGHMSRSRMHQFPFQVSNRTGIVHVLHQGIEGMPYVDSVADIIGYRPVYHSDVEIKGRLRQWHHAVDLCRIDSWMELLATHYLTTPEAICGAISLKLDSRLFDGDMSINATIARAMLEKLGIPEPPDRSVEMISRPAHDLSSPFCRTEDRGADAWMRVHAFEDGIVKRNRKGDIERVLQKEAA